MEHSQELVDVYSDALRDASQGASVAPLFSAAPDVLLIGTDPNEWWTGAEATRELDNTNQHMRDLGAEIAPGNPVGWEQQGVGWVVDRPTLRLPNGQIITFRLTALFIREGDDWKAIHQHWSIGVPNEQVSPFTATQGNR